MPRAARAMNSSDPRPHPSVVARTVAALAVLFGGGSLVLFGVFLILRPIPLVRFAWSPAVALRWDAALSAIFFLQHSGMVRRAFTDRLARWLAPDYHRAVYALASGLALGAVVLLWQPTGPLLGELPGALRWVPRVADGLALAGFVWAVKSLRHFDTFGVAPLVAPRPDQTPPGAQLVWRGPYRWVRHPLYFLMFVLIWSTPSLTADRLLFNVLWTGWIVVGAHLEERDLVVEFGDGYRTYQATVPMLFPWRGPLRRGSNSTP